MIKYLLPVFVLGACRAPLAPMPIATPYAEHEQWRAAMQARCGTWLGGVSGRHAWVDVFESPSGALVVAGRAVHPTCRLSLSAGYTVEGPALDSATTFEERQAIRKELTQWRDECDVPMIDDRTEVYVLPMLPWDTTGVEIMAQVKDERGNIFNAPLLVAGISFGLKCDIEISIKGRPREDDGADGARVH